MTLDQSGRAELLQKAREDMGDVPARNASEVEDRGEELQIASEWLIWKLNIENELKNTSDAVTIAEVAMTFIEDDRVPLKYRNKLAIDAATAHFGVSDIESVKRCLTLLGDRGSFKSVAERMKLLGDVAIYQSKPRDSDLFTSAIRTIASKQPPQVSDRDDEVAEKLARMALYGLVEHTRAVCGLARETNVLVADLSTTMRVFEDYVDGTDMKELIELAEVLGEIDAAASNRAPDRLLDPAIKLASLVRDDQSYPTLMRQTAQLTIFNAFVWWRIQTDDLARRQRLQQEMRNRLSTAKKADVAAVLKELGKQYPKAKDVVPKILTALDS